MAKEYHVRHKHLHPQNSTKKQRNNSKYATVAQVFVFDGRVSGGKRIIGEGIARCNKNDAVDKKVGSLLAENRALLDALNK